MLTVSIPHEDQSPYTPEQIQQFEESQKTPELIAGKFKTQDDLLKAYKELEKKLGQQSAKKPEETQETPKAPEESNEEPEVTPEAAYGTVITSAVSAAGLDLAEVTKEFESSGDISEESYKAFEQAGFPKHIVQAYLAGVKAQQVSQQELQESQVNEIKQMVGGDSEYFKVVNWAMKSLPQEELDAFNAAIEGGYNSAKWAVSALHAQYKLANGFEPEVISGKKPASSSSGYKSKEEMIRDMRDPKYKEDPAFRDKVAQKIKNSSIFHQS